MCCGSSCAGCKSQHCTIGISRRGFLAGVGASAFAAEMGVMNFASSVMGAVPKSPKKPKVRALFFRPKTQEEYWMTWPGQSYDAKAHQTQYTKTMTTAAASLGVDLEVVAEPISTPEEVNQAIEQLKQAPVDGVLLTVMCMPQWGMVNQFATTRGDTPLVVFSPMGTSFTGHLQVVRKQPHTFLGATQDVDWLAEAVKMFRVMHDMKNTRLLILRGEKVEDRTLPGLGTTLHYIPVNRWLEEFQKTETSDEIRAIADYYTKEAKKIVEPKPQDILNAAKNYVVARRLMADEKCDGISMDCLPLVRHDKVPCGPCLAWSKLNDEGSVGACEADWNAAISMRLTALLCDRPGFMQDPAPNTINNTLMGAHCTCPTRLEGFDKPHEPFILRTHSEPNKGVATQVLWPVDKEVTVMKFAGPDKMLLGTGKVVTNIDTPPSGGCRTSVELEMDDVANSLDCKGFHQLFICGKLDGQFKAYAQLAGIEVVPV